MKKTIFPNPFWRFKEKFVDIKDLKNVTFNNTQVDSCDIYFSNLKI